MSVRSAVLCGLVVVAACAGAAPAWAAGRIAFEGFALGEIFVVQPDGSGLQNLTQSAAKEGHPRWSPDGTKILYDRILLPGGRREVWVMNADGSDQRLLVSDSEGQAEGADWSPDGKQIAFIRDGPLSNDQEVWLANADGTGARKLAARNVNRNTLDWSPKGDSLVFTVQGGNETVLLRVDGSGETKILDAASQQAGFDPRFSPGADLITFTACPTTGCNGSTGLSVMNGNGSDRRSFIDPASSPGGDSLFDPAWSADGKQIVYARQPASGTRTLRVLNVDGTGNQPIPNTDNALYPDWEPTPPPSTPTSTPIPAPAPPPAVSVSVSRLKLAAAAFRSARRGPSIGTSGLKVTYALPAPGTVTFRVLRRLTGRTAMTCRVKPLPKTGKPCVRQTPLRGTFRHDGKAGTNTFRFTGRLAGRSLPAGSYTLAAQGPAGTEQRANFRITGIAPR